MDYDVGVHVPEFLIQSTQSHSNTLSKELVNSGKTKYCRSILKLSWFSKTFCIVNVLKSQNKTGTSSKNKHCMLNLVSPLDIKLLGFCYLFVLAIRDLGVHEISL